MGKTTTKLAAGKRKLDQKTPSPAKNDENREETARIYDERVKMLRDIKNVMSTTKESPKKKQDNDGLSEAKRARLERALKRSNVVINMENTLAFMPTAETGPEKDAQGRVIYNIHNIRLNGHTIKTNYHSPYTNTHIRRALLPLCRWCLQPQNDVTQLRRHDCGATRHPPGNEIYRQGNYGVFHIDGKNERVYCQHLCLLGKLFIESKTAHLNVEEFNFFIVCERGQDGYEVIAYFSKEKESTMNYNLSCILTLPPYQGRGIGKFMIDFSYLLARADGMIGSPEHPISDQGLVAYRAYWREVILEYLCERADQVEASETISIKALEAATGIHQDDIVSTLQTLYMIKYYRGKHLLYMNPTVLKQYALSASSRANKPGYLPRCDSKLLKWTNKKSKGKNAQL